MSASTDKLHLSEAASMVASWTGEQGDRARLTLLEWLRDGFLGARADRVIHHRLVASEAADPTDDPLLQAILAGPLPAWELPTEASVEDNVDLLASFWSPVLPTHAHADFWGTGRMTCVDGDGTRARRIYVGISVEHSELSAAAELNGFDLTAHASPEATNIAPSAVKSRVEGEARRPGRQKGSYNYAGDATIVARAIDLCDREHITLRRALQRLLPDIEPAVLDDESKIRRVRPKVLKQRPDLR